MVFLKQALCSLLIICAINTCAQQINVREYGAKGDGISNDYLALKKVVDKINKNKKGEVYFPPGNYFIDEYHNNDNISDLAFKDCNGLKIYGANAVISLKGNFNRSITKKSAKHSFSSMSAIIPFMINNCKNVTIENLEINGNVDKMTRDKGVVETGGYLIYISESENVTLKNLFLHHAQTDGLVIRGTKKPSFNIKASNVISSYNARQGMSIGYLTDGYFTNCKFINTGFSSGNYGNHAPSAGVDIEPSTGDSLKVKNVTFEGCEFSNNLGSQFVVSRPKLTQGIQLKNCVIDSKNSKSMYTLILAAKNILIANCEIKCGKGNIYTTWNGMPDGDVRIINSTIESSARGIVADASIQSKGISIENNTMKFTGNILTSYFPYLQNANVRFLNNRIFIPSKTWGVRKIQSLVQRAQQSSGNIFYSEDEKKMPKVSYQGVKIVNDN
ncbi:MAG: glycosyl hydrolase family 28-related protein [Pedobacter sp.]|jgi:polygalacturonase|uniref:glycosyl hydrolase family 28-related protein n=1 Tax=Pedobacter sp. TaxID=1411316 RepID=UPI003561C19C